MARKRNRFIPKPVLFIACEGTSTEFDYLTSWGQTDAVLEHYERVDVYPSENDTNPQTTPYELFLKAKDVKNNGSADFFWVVFDKDVHPKLPQTFSEAKAEDIKIAFSSRSFEEWILLHYEKNQTTFDATECKQPLKKKDPLNCGTIAVPACNPVPCLCGHIRRQGYIPNFEKTYDLYNEINGKTEIAIVNAAWLRFKKNASVNKTSMTHLYDINPYTDVDQLMLKLHERKDKIEWGNINEDVILDKWILNVTKNATSITARLSHTGHHAVVLNTVFPDLPFYNVDDSLNYNICNLINKVYYVDRNGSNELLFYPGDILEYSLTSNNQPYFVFIDESSNSKIFIEL